MTTSQKILLTALGAIISWGVISIRLKFFGNFLLDIPLSRSSHSKPIPTAGGIGVWIAVAVGLLVSAVMGIEHVPLRFIFAITIVSVIGFLDDLLTKGMNTLLRFTVQILVALVVIIPSGGLSHFPLPFPLNIELHPILGIGFSVVWIVGVINLFNFIDGLDGIAGLQALLVGLVIGMTGFGGEGVSAFAFTMAGGCVGFLIFNWSPAKVFMGNTGSYFLGFSLALIPFATSTGVVHENLFFIAIVLWFTLTDGVYTILRRALKGQKVWQADRSHLFKRLSLTGFKHWQVTLGFNAASLALVIVVLLFGKIGMAMFSWMTLVVALTFFVLYLLFTIQSGKRFAKNQPQ